ncbi:pyridoxine 5'-phosphate synthase, partial [Planctomycetota bacterium]
IQTRDLLVMKETVACKLNLELACEDEVLDIACNVRPEQITLVPERREEVTTEGGLDVVGNRAKVEGAIQRLRDAGMIVSLFLDPDEAQIRAGSELEVDAVELHTGMYSLAKAAVRQGELAKLANAGRLIRELGMTLHAGHGLDYRNVKPIAAIEGMCELNIGHSIVGRSIMVGMQQAVREMKQLITA